MLKVVNQLKSLVLGLGVLSVALTSCSDDDGPMYSSRTMENSELKTILMQKGYSFNEEGALLLDDLANNTTSLDLSGTGLTDFSGLEVFPNLTDLNISNNGYGPVFDLTIVPTQITGLDLRGNEIYDFEGLVNATVVNDEVQTTILRSLTKLYLPESAKWNVEDLMPFYTKNKADGTNIDMQMVNSNGVLEEYNTLREIPDEYFRAYLKMKFPNIFANETQIDISKSMGLDAGESINLGLVNQFADVNNIKSIEGIEYFINNPFYRSFFVSIYINNKVTFETSYLCPRENIRGLILQNTNTVLGIDFSKATKLVALNLTNNESITDIDLSNTLIGNQQISDFDASLQNTLSVKYCNNLKSLILPSEAVGVINSIELIQLPNLEAVDLSQINALETLALVVLPKCSIIYPSLKYTYYSQSKTIVELSDFDYILFAISEDVFKMTSTKKFFEDHPVGLMDEGYSYLSDGAYIWE